jgi:hypothetical protein
MGTRGAMMGWCLQRKYVAIEEKTRISKSVWENRKPALGDRNSL